MPFKTFAARFAAFAVLAALLAATPAAFAQTAGLVGHWEGAIELPGQKLGINLDFQADGEGWKGDISIPLQNAKDLPLINVKLEGANGETTTFEIQGIPGNPTFKGTLAGDKIAGDFTQGGGTFPFSVERAASGADAARKELEGYDQLVQGMIDAWRVPGLAVAIVKDGEVIYEKGFGFRDREKKLPVTPDTLFAIGSSTKAFTTFVMGTLVDEGKLDWDKPVATFLPGFKLYDRTATELMTPRDLVTHRSGLPRHDLSWYNATELSRKELVGRLAYMKPTYTLRERFQYNNFMFLTAGYLVEQVTGKSWEDNVRERIFGPLGMTGANFSVEDSQKTADFAQPYTEEEDESIKLIPFRLITNMGPAGSINASVRDMAKWVAVHLSGGKASGDRQLIGAATLADIHSPHMVIDEAAERPELSQPSYGMGWFIDTYRGHQRVEHGGNIDGFSALVTLLPQDGFGMVILTNKNGTGVPELLARHTMDRLLELEPINWNGEAIIRRDAARAEQKKGEAKKEEMRKPGTKPAHKLEEYAGEYFHPAYGTLRVAVTGGKEKGLQVTYNHMTSPLEHWHYETWNGVKHVEPPTFEDQKFLFQTDTSGNVVAVKTDFEPALSEGITFDKKPDSRMFDAAWLARFVGDYELTGQPVSIQLAGSVLTVNIPGQPQYHLVPEIGGEFSLKEASVFRVRFEEEAGNPGNPGKITGVTFLQPNGVFTAKRK
jgi:CubicO group peptidase (beta-lactamase class C family)